MDTPERRAQQRASYLRMRQDPAKLERYRWRKREWARRNAAAIRKKCGDVSGRGGDNLDPAR